MNSPLTLSLFIAGFSVFGLVAWKSYVGGGNVWHQPSPSMTSFHDLNATTLDGKTFSFSELQGKRVLVVNTASRCGYTPQYKPLEALHEKFGKQGLVILGFPCNQFGWQEPGDASDIREFCSENYGVTFQMMAKVDVKGDDQHPVYAWLTNKNQNGVGDHSVKWNFNKFLVNGKGELVAALGSGADPLGEEILAFAKGQ